MTTMLIVSPDSASSEQAPREMNAGSSQSEKASSYCRHGNEDSITLLSGETEAMRALRLRYGLSRSRRWWVHQGFGAIPADYKS